MAILLHEEGLNGRFRIYAIDINEEVIRRSVEKINFEMKRSVDKNKISDDDWRARIALRQKQIGDRMVG